jgi:hypothetical protein
MSGWVCPVHFAARPEKETDPTGWLNGLLEEIAGLSSWCELGKEKRGRTTVGLSGLDIEPAVRFIVSFLDSRPMENPRSDLDIGSTIKFACDDLRAYYSEAAVSQPGSPTGHEIAEWFWGQTLAAKMLLCLRPVLVASKDKSVQATGMRGVIPYDQMYRLEK